MRNFYEVTVRIYGNCYEEVYTYDGSDIRNTKQYYATQDCIMLIDAKTQAAAESIALDYVSRDSCDIAEVTDIKVYNTRYLGVAEDAKRDIIHDVRYEDVN